MVWKTEKWMQDIFPGKDKIYSEYRLLPRRELAIVAGAVLDSALAEILFKRLSGSDTEIHSFLGLNGDGRAPCGSFGARVQLAFLLGVITQNDVLILRGIKNLRNKFAHEVKADFNSASVMPIVENLHDNFLNQSNALIEAGYLGGSKHSLDLIRPLLSTTPEVGAAMLLAVFSVYQAYFHRIYDLIEPIVDIEIDGRV